MGGYFYIFSDLLCKKFSLSNISDLFLHFSRFVLWTSFSHIYIYISSMGKKLQAFHPISLLHCTSHNCHDEHYDDGKEYDDDVYDDDDMDLVGHPRQIEQQLLNQGRGRMMDCSDHNTSSPASPILTLLIKVSL